MRNTLIAAGILTFLVILSGCATAPANPTSPTDTLLVGQLIFNLSGFGSYGGATVNGKQTQGVQISLKNVTTGKIFKTETHGPNGLFYLPNLTPADYLIVHLYYKALAGRAWADVNFRPGPPPQFRLAPTGVSDIGTVIANFGDNGQSNVSLQKAYNLVRSDFSQKFPRSKWNTAGWSPVSIYTGE